MIRSPLELEPAFALGPLVVSRPVVVTWGLMALLIGVSALMTRRLRLRPNGAQAFLELIVETLDAQIKDTMRVDPAPYRTLFGGLFLFILAANWASLIPGVEPPTARIETDAALAAIVFCATIYYGLRAQGLRGYLKTFAEPSLFMVPLNLVEQLTRSFSLILRLFGNVMSGVFVVAIMLSLAGLLVPIPLMALDLLTGAVQAYIFTTLAMVFTAAAVSGDAGDGAQQGTPHGSD